MNKSRKMENNFLVDVVGDYILVFIGFTGGFIGLDSLPQGETIIQAVNTVNTESTIDIVTKVLTLFSLCISSVAGFIPIIKFIKRNKNK